jgi:hypothetical protein
VGRLCTICTHDQRQEIDEALVVHQASYRNIAQQFSVDYVSLFRHGQEHLRLMIWDEIVLGIVC